jgi:hypothetical protein
MNEPDAMPYLLCMLAGPRVIVLTTANSSHEALRYASAGSRSMYGNKTLKRVWIEARDRPATSTMPARRPD